MLGSLGGFEVTVCSDWGQGMTENYRMGWQAFDPEADWHLVMEDDCQLPSGFQRSVVAALDHAPEWAPVSLFSIAPRYRTAYNDGFSWYVDNGTNTSVALAVPGLLVPEFLLWEAALVAPEHRWFCQRLTSFCQAQALPVQYTLPCLVEHAAPGESLAGNPTLAGGTWPRVASSFVDPAPPPEYWLGPTIWKNNHAQKPPASLR
jgi:hypothetical protein